MSVFIDTMLNVFKSNETNNFRINQENDFFTIYIIDIIKIIC